MASGHRLHGFFKFWIHIGVVQNGFGVHTNVVVDDEFQTRQPHAMVGQLRKVKSQLRVANVHGDLDRNVGHFAALHFGDFGFQKAVVDVTGVSLRAAHGHQGAFFQRLGGSSTAHHRWNTQFAGNDGGVASAAATVGHNGAGPLHDRLPVGVGHVGHQHIASLHRIHFAHVLHQTHGACANFLSNGAALSQHGATAFEFVALL